MTQSILAILAGFALLLWGADRFVAGASATARNLGVSPLLIGLTIVGFGTSAPEILISAMAALDGNPGLALGNAIGSNITNIALIIGTTALISPLQIHSDTLKREFPILLATMLVALVLLADGDLNRVDGAILLAGLGFMLYSVVGLGIRDRADPLGAEYAAEIPTGMSTPVALAWLVAGLALLLVSSRMLVWGAVNLATMLGISDLIIGLTIVAIGTSLPELAASVVSALRGEDDIAIGNVIGSNMFNLLAVMGLPGVIHPAAVPPEVLERDFLIMIGLTLALFAMSHGLRGPGRVNRIEGSLLLLAFVGYQGLLYYQTVGAGR